MKKWFLQIMKRIPLISPETKRDISFGLLCLAYIGLAMRPTLDSKIIVLAMFLSTIGDFLMNWTSVEERPHSMLYAGAVFFMAAHFVYAIAYYSIIRKNSYDFFNPAVLVSTLFIVFIVFGIISLLYKLQQKINPTMTIVFGIYVCFISLNFITICSYSESANSICFLGALSFLISDLIIGIENLFKIKNENLRKLVWIFYPIGQAIIILCR